MDTARELPELVDGRLQVVHRRGEQTLDLGIAGLAQAELRRPELERECDEPLLRACTASGSPSCSSRVRA